MRNSTIKNEENHMGSLKFQNDHNTSQSKNSIFHFLQKQIFHCNTKFLVKIGSRIFIQQYIFQEFRDKN